MWSPEKAASLLAEVHAGNQGEACHVDPVTQEELTRALDADPAYLEATWAARQKALEGVYGWTAQSIDGARTRNCLVPCPVPSG